MPAICAYARIGRERRDTEGDIMSKSLQKGIIFAVCILLVCALGVTLFILDGTGGAVTGQEGQASAVAQNMATYTHGSNIGRALPSDYTSVSN